MSNLDLWNSVQETDPKQTKKAKIGQMSITAICPQYQRKNATRKFGSYGIGWGIVPNSEVVDKITIGDTLLGTYQATMFYIFDGKEGKFPISSTIKIAYMTRGNNPYLKIDDEFMKKLQTDALTKGLSFLGFNSDIFEGLFDDNRYVESMKIKHNINEKLINGFYEACKEVINADVEEMDYQRVQLGFSRLDTNEQIALWELIGSDKPEDSKRGYKAIIKSLLDMKEGEKA